MTVRFRHRGASVFLEESHDLPVVDVAIKMRGGSLGDPEGLEGLTRVTGRLLRRGTKTLPSEQVDREVARLGARLTVTISRGVLGLQGSVLERNIEPFLELVAHLLREPAFRNADLARAKRRIRADLATLREDDHALGSRYLKKALFQGHPYGRPTGGTHASVGRLKRSHLVERHRELWVGRNVVFGAAGAIDEDTFRSLLKKHFADLEPGKAKRTKVPAPKSRRGRRLLIVDKPGRSQTQLGVATLGVKARDSFYFPFLVADAAFGGMFTSRLMQAVRADRGWSYSAYSSHSAGSQRDAWRMWTHPSVDNTHDCLALQLELLEEWAENGATGDEIKRAKRYLRGGRCFDEDTAFRRLDSAMTATLHGLGDEHLGGYRKAISKVTMRSANDAVRKRIRPDNITIVAVGDAKRLSSLEDLASEVDVVRYDAKL